MITSLMDYKDMVATISGGLIFFLTTIGIKDKDRRHKREDRFLSKCRKDSLKIKRPLWNIRGLNFKNKT